MRPALIILARVPYMGMVKTRLARDIGFWRATFLYRKMLAHVIKQALIAKNRIGVEPYIALTPHHLIFPMALPILFQTSGDLGRKMEHILHQFRQPIIFIGSDSLALSQRHLSQAVKALHGNDIVLAPAGDGGYGLIGLRNCHFPIFRDIRWSSPHTLADSCKRARHKRVHLLPLLPDIDDAHNLGKSSAKLHGR